jgi:hypothetical protein
MTELPDRIPEDSVATILARAAELDRSARETVGLDVIRAAALEAGISAGAVDRALAEYSATPAEVGPEVEAAGVEADERPRWRRWLGRIATPLKLGAAAFLGGILAGGIGEEPVLLLAWLAFVYLGVRLARRVRPSRRLRGFAVSMVLMTVAAMLGLGAVEANEDAIIAAFMTGPLLLVLGGVYIKLPRRRAAEGQVARGELTAPAR